MRTKFCTVCDELKPLSEFSFRCKSRGKLQSKCKGCQSEAARSAYLKSKDKYKARARINNPIYRARTRDYIWEVLSAGRCVDCGETDPIVLEFDHVRGVKEFEISKCTK